MVRTQGIMTSTQGIFNEGEGIIADIHLHWWFWRQVVIVFVMRVAIVSVAGVPVLNVIAGIESASKDLCRPAAPGAVGL